MVTTNTLERSEGLKRLNKALDAIKEEITAAKGDFKIEKEVRLFFSLIPYEHDLFDFSDAKWFLYL